jgi:hypothetical protein
MSDSNTKKMTELARAALALDEELRRFEALTASALRVPLDSKKNLERAAAACQQRVSELVHAFMAALNVAREANQRAAEQLTQKGAEVQARSAVYSSLYEKYAALGQEAGARYPRRFARGAGDRVALVSRAAAGAVDHRDRAGFCLQPATPAIGEAVNAIVEACATRRTLVVNTSRNRRSRGCATSPLRSA